jgi:uncharacterized protein (DUF1684 family)
MQALALAVTLLLSDQARASSAGYAAEIQKHRDERVADLTKPNGWLAVAGLFWLHEGMNTAGSDPDKAVRLPARAPKTLGAFELKQGTVTFTADAGVRLTANGKPVNQFTFEPEKGEDSAIAIAGLTLFVIKRGDRYAVRLLDPETDQRRGFKGLRYFPVQRAFRVRAVFKPYAKARQVPVPNVLGMTVPMESPGYVTFTLNGKSYRLEPVYETEKREDLFFIFKDLTSGKETYGAGRFLHTPLPKNGSVDLDFNKAYNPPCAFTAFATCPLPTKQNQLPVAIRAGELNYAHK